MLSPGDVFPALRVPIGGGDLLAIPEALEGHFAVVLFFRGSWCPYCNAQLRAFERAGAALAELDARVVALSVDDETTTQQLIAKHDLHFPVGFGADPHLVANATGAFLSTDPAFLQSTGFLLDREGRVLVSVYSSGAIGRLVPDDVIGMLRYLKTRAEKMDVA